VKINAERTLYNPYDIGDPTSSTKDAVRFLIGFSWAGSARLTRGALAGLLSMRSMTILSPKLQK